MAEINCLVGIATRHTLTSANGSSWDTPHYNVLSSGYRYSIAWNGSVFCTLKFNSSEVAISSDGVSWDTYTLPASAPWYKVIWNGTVFCAVCNSSSVCATSPDGINWTQGAMPSSSNWTTLCWTGSVFMSVSSNELKAAISSDGLSWSATSTAPPSYANGGLACNGSLVCGVVKDTSTVFTTSDNGATWGTHTAISGGWLKLIWNGSKFCCIGNTNKSMTSTNGSSWSQGTMPSYSNWMALTWDGTRFITAVYNSNKAAISTNGTSWTAKTLPLSDLWEELATKLPPPPAIIGNLPIAVSFHATMNKSRSGMIGNLPVTVNLHSMMHLQEKFAIVGDLHIALNMSSSRMHKHPDYLIEGNIPITIRMRAILDRYAGYDDSLVTDNRLIKDFIETQVYIPAQTITHWIPEVSQNITRYFGYHEGNKVYSTPIVAGNQNSPGILYFTWMDFDAPEGTNTIHWILINGIESSVVVTPGHYWFEVIPGHYSKTVRFNNGWNASARSIFSISRDGIAKFTVHTDVAGVVVGLNNANTSYGSDYLEISHGIYFSKGNCLVSEHGVWKTEAIAYNSSDVFSVTRVDTHVFYAKNKIIFYSSKVPSVGQIIVDCSLYTSGDAIHNAALYRGTPVDLGTAEFTVVTELLAETIPTAEFKALTVLSFDGVYAVGNDVYVSAVRFEAIPDLDIVQDTGYADFTVVTELLSEGHFITEVAGILRPLTALSLGGFQDDYTVMVGVLPALTVTANDNEIVAVEDNFTIAYCTFSGLSSYGIIVGGSNSDTVMELPSLQARGGDYVYTEVIASLVPLLVNALSYPLLGDYCENHLGMEWYQVSATWLTEIQALVNAERAAAGVTPAISLYSDTSYYIDIASKHNQDMIRTGIYAHVDAAYGFGWIAPEDRMLSIPLAHYIIENLTIGTNLTPESIRLDKLTPTIVHQAWKDSPAHRWGYLAQYPEGSIIKMLLAVDFFGTITSPAGFETDKYPVWATENFINVGTSIDGILHVIDLSMEWETLAYPHIAARNEEVYALRLAIQHEQPSGVRVAAQNNQPFYYTLQADSEHGYGQLGLVQAVSEQGYSLDLRNKVAIQNVHSFSLQLIAMSEQPYESLRITAQVEQGYTLSDAPTIKVQNVKNYSLMVKVTSSSSHRYGNKSFVVAANEQNYELSVYNKVLASLCSFYSLLGDSYLVVPSDTITVLVQGIEIEVDALSLTLDEGNFVWHSELALASQEDALLFSRLSLFQVVINMGTVKAETWNLVTDTKSITRSGFGDVDIRVIGFSPSIIMSDPYADPITYIVPTAMLASEIADLVAGTVEWNTYDWMIPAYRFGMTLTMPIQALNTLVEVIGGVIQSSKAGVIQVRPLYPVHIKDYNTAIPDQVFSDLEDNLSSTEDGTITTEQNKFRITESNSSFSDTIEMDSYPYDEMMVLLRVLPVPWRESVQVVSANGTGVEITPLGVQSRIISNEQVEFVRGQCTFRYYPISFISMEWKTPSLGTIVPVLPRSTTWIAADLETNNGYGIMLVSYNTESLNYAAKSIVDLVDFLVTDEDFAP
jgi:hypothetical protein